jgi:predicted TIM-barrel fold metal-dependent hydrolase
VTRNYEVISADAHIEAPPVWAERIPEGLRERAPRIVSLPDGGDGWQLGDGEPAPLGLQLTGGMKYTEFIERGQSYADDLPGAGGPAQRLAEQDRDGVDAEVLFSSVVATALKKVGDDGALQKAIATAYNSWASEYCAHEAERLLGVGIIPFTGIDDAVEELERIALLPALRGAMLLQFPSGRPTLSDEDERFWAAHPLPGLRKEKAMDMGDGADLGLFAWLLTCDLPLPTLPIVTLLQLILGGPLDRHPNLRFHFAETGIGWLPYWLEQMEDRFDRHRFWAKVSLQRRPVEYVRDHFTFSFQEDHAGVALRHMIGVDNICWASDFPHSVGDWPWSREVLARSMAGVPDDERRRIQALNIAAQLRVIDPAEKDRLAVEPLTPLQSGVPARGERRTA